MAKIKVKQIDDLSLANSTLTVGAGQVEFQDEQAGKYVSGFTLTGTKVTPTFKDLPAADTFGTGLKVTPEGATAGRTITLDDAHVIGLFGIAEGTTAAPTNSYMSGLTYADGVFTPAYTALPTIGDGKLTIKFNNAGITAASTEIFNANQSGDTILTLASVAGSGDAADVVVTANERLGLTSTTVQAALEELQGKINDLQAIDPVETTVAAGTGIKVEKTATTEGGNDWTYTVSQDIKLELSDNILQVLPNSEGANTPIATVDLSQFAIDGMLDNATYDSASKDLTLTFNTAAGKNDIVVPLDGLVDTYKADEIYIKVADNKFSHVEKTGLPETAQGISAAVTLDTTHKTGTFNVPTVTVDKAGHVSVLGQQQVSITLPDAPATTTKKVYTPKEQKQTGTATFTVEAGACHFRMYMNGQLLDSTAYTISGNSVEYNPTAYVPLEGTDRMDLIYFIEEEITVFGATAQGN